MGLDAFIVKKHISKYQKILKNSGVHLDILCPHTKFRENKYFYNMCKKDKKCLVKSHFIAPKFIILHKPHKKYFFAQLCGMNI